MNTANKITRREMLAATAAAGLAAATGPRGFAATEDKKNSLCAFIKFLQEMPYDQLAETIAEMGFDGIEATVRPRGYILPENAEDELPKLVEALRNHGLEITIMTTDISSVDQPHTERVLRTAAALGIQRYRMSYYRYDLSKPVAEQLQAFKPVAAELADLNRQLGISAVYQNHAGAKYLGASCWDLYELLRDRPVREIGVAFDIRHATVEGGLAWPVYVNLLRPHFGAVCVKDFVWHGRRPENVPLGDGQVDPAFFKMLRQSDYTGPISLHIEYLEQAGLKPNIKALQDDLTKLRTLIGTP